jgi:AcrR family transcriptional regulator
MSAREKILDAAAQRLLDHGPAGLVLDSVAADAGVSKGGLLYHFASKEALVEGLTQRMLEGFEQVQLELAQADPEPTGRNTRAYLASTVTPRAEPADSSAQLMAGLLAGLGGDSARLESVREAFSSWQARLEQDDIDPVRATLVRLVADGLWLSALLGLPPLEARLAASVMAELDVLTRSPA